MSDKKWIISYVLNSDLKSISTLQLIALPEFNEVGEYTEEQCPEIIKIINSVPLPKFEKEHWWGNRTFEEWDKFVGIVNNKIKEYVEY